jgi:hypothetical protein
MFAVLRSSHNATLLYMADVSFDEEPTYRYAAAPNTLTKRGGLSGLLIRSKIANDERGAQYVLIVIAVVAILAYQDTQ